MLKYMNMRSYPCCTQEDNHINNLVSLLKILADKSRLRILCLLQNGSHCVCELEENLQLSQSLISHHLADLKKMNLIKHEKKGQFTHYQLTKKGERVTGHIYKLNQKEKNEN